MKTSFYARMSHYEKLNYLTNLVKDECKKIHVSLCVYVQPLKKIKDGVSEFERLIEVNNAFEQNVCMISFKYGRHLEGQTGPTVEITDDEMNAFTRAYHLQKEALKHEIETLKQLGADDAIKFVDADLIVWLSFLKEFQPLMLTFGKK